MHTSVAPQARPRLSHREQSAYFAALRAGRRTLDRDGVAVMLGIAPDYATILLGRLMRKGAVERVGQGLYAVVPPEVLFERRTRGVDPPAVLHALMARHGLADAYYVAYQSAAHLHGAAHQVPVATYVAVTRQLRSVDVGVAAIRFVRILPRALFGIEQRRYQAEPLRVSDRERTALDLVDRPALGGGIEEVARTVRALLEGGDVERLVEYARRLGRRATAQRLGYLLDALEVDWPGATQEQLRATRGRATVLLEPGGRRTGELAGRWGVRVNADMDETR